MLLVGVGAFATHVLKRPAVTVNKQRERKFWMLIWVLFAASLIELVYSTYEQTAKPNPKCDGLFPVRSTQESNKVGNSLTWLVHKLISTVLCDVTVLLAFWPTKVVHSPLLKDYDIPDSDSIPKFTPNRSYLSEDGVSMIDDHSF